MKERDREEEKRHLVCLTALFAAWLAHTHQTPSCLVTGCALAVPWGHMGSLWESVCVCVDACVGGWGEFTQCQPLPSLHPSTLTHTHTDPAPLLAMLQMMYRPAAFSSLWWWVFLPNARQPESHLLLSLSPRQYCQSLHDNQHMTGGNNGWHRKIDESIESEVYSRSL